MASPYTYGFRAVVRENGKMVGISHGECPADEILISPVQAVGEVVARVQPDWDVRDAWLIDGPPSDPQPLVA